MKKVINLVAALSLSVSTASVDAWGGQTTLSPQQIMQLAFELPQDKQQGLFFLALTGASQESISRISADLEKFKNQPLPHLTLVNNQVVIDGKKSGVVLNPDKLQVEYRGRIWTYRKNKAMDENYFSLRDFLTTDKISKLNLFIDEAHAIENEYVAGAVGAAGGAVLGYGVANLAADAAILSFAVITAPGTLALIGIGAIVCGGWYAWNVYKRKHWATNTMDEILRSNFTIMCSPEAAIVTIPSGKNKSQIRIGKDADELVDSSGEIKIFSGKNRLVDDAKLSDSQKLLIRELQNCKSEEQALSITAAIKNAAKMVAQVGSQKKPAPNVNSAVTK